MTSPPWVRSSRLAEVLTCPLPQLLRIAAEAGRCYQPYDLVLPGKKPRHIDNPTGKLRALQKRLTTRIFRHVQFPGFLFGSVRGRSAIDMARLHVGQPCVVAVDIRACFPSTRAELVRTALVQHAGFGRETAALVTKLTTFHDSLPQGAPTSSYLLNLAMLDLHRRLHREASKQGLTYTVFVDDIVVSGKNPEPMLDRIATDLRVHGFQLSHKKKRVMRGAAQEVLGLSLHPRLDAKPSFYERFDKIVMEARDAGSLTTKTKSRLDGMVAHLHAVNQGLGGALRTLLQLLMDEVLLVESDLHVPPRLHHAPCKHRRRHRRHAEAQPMASQAIPAELPSAENTAHFATTPP